MSADGGQARPLRARSVEHHPHCALAGPCMCHDTLRMPVTGDHVWEAVRDLGRAGGVP